MFSVISDLCGSGQDIKLDSRGYCCILLILLDESGREQADCNKNLMKQLYDGKIQFISKCGKEEFGDMRVWKNWKGGWAKRLNK